MKIIFLNTWNGKVREDIAEFIKEQSRDTDVFCFQEAYDEMKLLCKDILTDYRVISIYKFVREKDDFFQATYVRKNIKILSSGIVFEKQMDCGLGVYTEVQSGNNSVHIGNFHGLSRPGEKLDTPNRLQQSRDLVDFFKGKSGLKIIGGDFNVLPDTQSIQMFEENGYRDLIKDYRIPTTRNRLVWESYPDNKQFHSDYVFISSDAKIRNFSVPDIEVSDHLPMILEI